MRVLLTALARTAQAAIRRLLPRRVARGEAFQPLVEWADDPAGFAREVLGVTLWEAQVKIASDVRDHPRVTVSACYGSGKTFLAAVLVLWWLYTRRPAMVVTTAPTGRQVKALLWREIRKLHRRAKRKLAGKLLTKELVLADDWFAMGFSSDRPNSVAGLHEAANVLFIEDEAAGMPAEVVEGYDGITATEGSRHLKIGNPLCKDGPFWDSHNKKGEKERWKRHYIKATDTPNVKAKKTVVPGLVSWEWVQDKLRRWGQKHPHWVMKVLGRFWVAAAEKVLPETWVALAAARWHELTDEGPRILGADIAGGGQDDTVLALRTGRRIRIVEEWHEEDLMRQARRILELALFHLVDEVRFDYTGLGQGVYQRAEELQDEEGLGDHVQLIPVRMGNKPELEPDVYNRRSDEVQFMLRNAFDPSNQNAVAIDPDDTETQRQLSVRGWTVNSAGKIEAEGKKALRKRGVDSPDRADAVSLTTLETDQELVVFAA